MKKLHIISHTHWDREWYSTFQTFRRRLVAVIDQLIEHMEQDESYSYFQNDGQTLTLEDYLEMRPQNEQRIKKLIQDGRLLIGPWYSMPDEFLVSGESLVRNLQKGIAICKRYGVAPLNNGYICDIFGHNSQMPQIFRKLGIDSATLFRGVGAYDKAVFTWASPDGSSVTAVNLDHDRCYSNFYFAVRWPYEDAGYTKACVQEGIETLLQLMEKRNIGDSYLMMDGVDHVGIEPKLSQMIEYISEMEDIEVVHSTIPDYVAEVDTSLLDTLHGELRFPGFKGLNDNVLAGVLSSMVHLKQQNDACERLLTKWAEPLSVFCSILKLRDYEQPFLQKAWEYLFKNHPHDSICGCSITPVHQDNEYRFRQAHTLASDIVADAAESIRQNIDGSSFEQDNTFTLFNSSLLPYHGIAHVEIGLPPKEGGHNILIKDNAGNPIPYQIISVDPEHKTLKCKHNRLPVFLTDCLYTVSLQVDVPEMGYNTYSYESYTTLPPHHGDYTFHEYHAPIRYAGSMRTAPDMWDNGSLIIKVNSEGSLDITDKETGVTHRRMHIFEDGQDCGDGWNYGKPIADSVALGLGSAAIFVLADGCNTAQIRICKTLHLPKERCATGNERAALELETVVTIHRDSRIVSFVTKTQNAVKDHRLRVLFPFETKAKTFYTTTPFDLVERSFERTDYSYYKEDDTGCRPNQGVFAIKDDITVAIFNKGLYEIEAMENKTVALTLFRSFDNEIGKIHADMGRLLRPLEFKYALYIGHDITVPVMANQGEMYRNSLLCVYGEKPSGNLICKNSLLRIQAEGVEISCFKLSENGNMYVLRLYNLHSSKVSFTMDFILPDQPLYQLDLNEESLCRIEREITIGAKEIYTIGIPV